MKICEAAILIAFILLMAGCEQHSAPVQSAAAPPAPTATAAPSPATTATPASSPTPVEKLYSYDLLKLTRDDGVDVRIEMQFGARFASEEKYIKMFGRPHTDMIAQEVVVDGEKCTVTYAGFNSSADAAEAFKHTNEPGKFKIPAQVAVFGNYVVVIQTGAADAAKLDKAAAKIKQAIAAKTGA